MKVFHHLPESSGQLAPIILTIGNFDGVHLGHRSILVETVQMAKQKGVQSAALSFSNHPSTVLREGGSTHLLCTPEHKIRLLEAVGLDLLYLIPFNKELSDLSAEQFLSTLQAKIPFSHLILGADAALGKGRSGNQSVIENLAQSLHFKVAYLPDFLLNGERISSSQIRRYIHHGELLGAANCLGRPYSIYSIVNKGAGRGQTIGIPTANISVANLCIPPLGVYVVELRYQKKSFPAVANLGLAPTFRLDNTPVLEVHVWDHTLSLFGEFVEVVFHQFIRPEKLFSQLEDLQQQIANDIMQAKLFFNATFHLYSN